MRAGKNKLSNPGQVYGFAALGAIVLAMLSAKYAPDVEQYARAVVDGAQAELSHSDDRAESKGYSDKDFKGMAQKPVTAGRGAGFYDLVLCANPDFDDLFSSGAAAEESDYLKRELQKAAGRSGLQLGDRLDVPVLPVAGQKPNTHPSVCSPDQNTT